GELEVFKHGRGGNDLRVALLGPGDWFGDMSMVDPQPRSASVRAIAPSLLLRISPDQLETTLIERDVHTYAILMRNLARELSRRLRVADGILAQMVVSVGEAYRGPSTSGR
ncbi:MAG: cyclic nucleotide-binding domain-containing protein, partial [Myxococcales bacterium]|nr:cyclic nucleotide-binding domain-containing protein [Myxococcales bacterium]